MSSIVKAGQSDTQHKFQCLRLARAEEGFDCTVENHLHRGSIGELSLLASVVMAAGEYEWPVLETGGGRWHKPFQSKFDASDRGISFSCSREEG